MKIIKRAHKFRINPTTEQLAVLLQWVGNTRFVYNNLLSKNIEQYKKDSTFIFAHQMTTSLPGLKEEYTFLKLSPSQSLQFVARCLDRALKDSFSKDKGFPKFKSKHKQRDSLTIFQAFIIGKNSIKLPKMGKIKLNKHRAIKGKIKHITISRSGNYWYCSIYTETKARVKEKKYKTIVGIDVGIKQFAVCSDETIIDNPRILLKHQGNLAFQQKLLSKKQVGSNNFNKQKNKVIKVHSKIKNTRNDFQHKASHDMITKYDGIVLEDLCISGMLKNDKLAKHIADVGWHEFARKLKYKLDWHDKEYVTIGRFEPTSKSCSNCGWINSKLCLSDRIFECQTCSLILDRDLNAAINIRNKGLEKLPWGARDVKPVELVKLQTSSSQWLAMNQEKECLSPSNS